jgi:putative intracellular protease/amidase
MIRITRHLLVALAAFTINPSTAAESLPESPAAAAVVQTAEKIDSYVPRFGRSRPLVAVVGENSGTVLSDYVIPYGVLSQSGLADVVSVATDAGVLKLPPLQINPDSSVAQFDLLYPDGADYVIVPALKMTDDPTLITWLTAQAAKGATMISICNGSQVLAKAGLTRGHRATGHWSTHKARVKAYPETDWRKNKRYVADGKLVSSAGITAAMPVSLALVEAIGGTARAEALATRLGAAYWGTDHNSDAFGLTFGDYLQAITNTVFRRKQDLGVPVADGIDEIALALTAEAYSATLRSRVYSIAQSKAPVKTRGGLMLVPDRVAGQDKLDEVLPELDETAPGRVPDKLLNDITARYGTATARFVVLEWEYPGADVVLNKE